jgi:hypothetical protein
MACRGYRSAPAADGLKLKGFGLDTAPGSVSGKPSLFSRAIVKNLGHAEAAAYVHHLSQAILSLGAHGRCVIIGRGAAQILPAQTTLRVRLIGPRERRPDNNRLRSTQPGDSDDRCPGRRFHGGLRCGRQRPRHG